MISERGRGKLENPPPSQNILLGVVKYLTI